MESQFRGRAPTADAEHEAASSWLGKGQYHFNVPIVAYEGLGGTEAVGPPESGAWMRYRSAELGSESKIAYLRVAARVHERLQALAVVGPDSRNQAFARKWADKLEPEARARFELDLEYVLRRLELIFAGHQGLIWLESFNYNLDGRPIDVLRGGDAARVIAAADAEEKGAL